MGYGHVVKESESPWPADDCHNLPHSNNDFLSAQQMDFVCDHRKMWMRERDERVSDKDFEAKTTG